MVSLRAKKWLFLVELKKAMILIWGTSPDDKKEITDRSVIEYWILAALVSGVTAFMAVIGAMTTAALMRGYKQPFVTPHL